MHIRQALHIEARDPLDSTSASVDSPTDAADETVIEIHADASEPFCANSSCCSCSWCQWFFYVFPGSVALTDAADIGRSLYTSKTSNRGIIITASLAAFLTSFGLTGEPTKQNFKETFTLIRTRTLPEGWVELPRKKEIAAIVCSILPTIWGAFSEWTQGYYFVDGIPSEYQFDINVGLWAFISACIATGAATTNVFTDSIEMYKIIRERLVWKPTIYSNRFSSYASPLVGGTLGLMKASQDAIQAYIATTSIFSLTSTLDRSLIAVPNILNIIPSFCFAGVFSINAMDEFFGYIPNMKWEPNKFLAFSLSAALAIYLAFWKRALNESFYVDIAQEFGAHRQDVPGEAVITASWAMFVQESILGTASVYEPMLSLINKVQSTVTNLGQRLSSFCFPSQTESDSSITATESYTLLVNDDHPAPPSASDDDYDSSSDSDDFDFSEAIRNAFEPDERTQRAIVNMLPPPSPPRSAHQAFSLFSPGNTPPRSHDAPIELHTLSPSSPQPVSNSHRPE